MQKTLINTVVRIRINFTEGESEKEIERAK